MLKPMPFMIFTETIGGDGLQVEIRVINHEELCILLMRVLKQRSRRIAAQSDDNRVKLSVSGGPQLSDSVIYVRGSDENRDNAWVYRIFSDETRVQVYVRYIEELVAKVNQ